MALQWIFGIIGVSAALIALRAWLNSSSNGTGHPSIRDSLMRRTQAVVLIQRTLEHWHETMLVPCPVDTRKLGLDLVGAAWLSAPPVFEGQGSVPPHPLSIAVYSLSLGLAKHRNDERTSVALGLALGSLLKEVPKYLNVLAMSPADATLVDEAHSAFTAYGESMPKP